MNLVEELVDKGINIGRNEGINIGRNEGINIGRDQGRLEKQLEIARELLQDGHDPLYVQRITHLTHEQIKTLQTSDS